MASLTDCDPEEVSLKSFFLGPQSENGEWFTDLTIKIIHDWLQWRQSYHPLDGRAISESDQKQELFLEQQNKFRSIAMDLAQRFEAEIPKFSPRYMGHMFSEISLPALIGHWVATLHNPNNIATESAPVGVQIEREAIALLVSMLGYSSDARGHFTSCGSIANLEASLRARDRAVGLGHDPLFLVPQNKHYSWLKAAHVLGLKKSQLEYLDLDESGSLDVLQLERKLEKLTSEGRIPSLIVSVLGSTELGNIDPINEVQLIKQKYFGDQTWHHVDAAYGGFFASLKGAADSLGPRIASALKGLSRVDSITIDPHKLGYVPYACGAFICRSKTLYPTKVFDSPYIQYTDNTDPGLYTLEGSRSAAGAAATWLTLKAIGDDASGYGRIVRRSLALRESLEELLRHTDERICVLGAQHTNILCFSAASEKRLLSEGNLWADQFYKNHCKREHSFVVSKTKLASKSYSKLIRRYCCENILIEDTDELTLVRLTLMNPFLRSKEMAIDIMKEFCEEVAASLG